MHFALIEDASDPRLADYRNIPDPELVRAHGLFVAEGRLVVRRLLTDRRFETRSVIITEAARAALGDVLAARPDVPVYVVPLAVMNRVTGFHIHRGCLAIGERPPATPWTDLLGRGFRLQPEVPPEVPKPEAPKPEAPKPNTPKPDATTLVVLERVANADNVGGVFRNAAAFGADAVLLDPVSTDPLYRKAIRTSMGAALAVPFARAEPWPDALRALATRGFAIIALTPASTAAPLTAVLAAATASRPVAFVLGHEGEGLTDGALDACTHRARIPIAAGVDSLNIAAAAAVALYERRRHDV